MRLWKVAVLLPALALVTAACAYAAENFTIGEIRMAKGIDADFRPVEPMEVFPAGTSKVFCWFNSKDGDPSVPLLARWHYVTENIPVLEYKFTLTGGEVFFLQIAGETIGVNQS